MSHSPVRSSKPKKTGLTDSQQEKFFSKSLVTSELPNKAMSAACNYWFSTAKSISRDWFIIVDMYGGKNAYIPNVKDSMAYAHRDKLFLYEFYDRVPNGGQYPSNGLSFLNGWTDAFTNNLTPSQWAFYINYAGKNPFPDWESTFADKFLQILRSTGRTPSRPTTATACRGCRSSRPSSIPTRRSTIPNP